ncbi:MAG: response regulator, partial [Clostridia bacterium]|nr:response regulator [Clostridia bacterium]
MYKMLVVDDEYLARTGICETIDWQQYDISIVATAVNGKDGLDKVAQYQPDIIISDIKMPVMDGTQLVASLYEQNYDGIIIILSGYNDFEYAKTTLENGVFKYLLKPIDNDELVEVVLKAKDKLAKRRKMDMFLSDFDRGIPIIKNSIADSIFHGCPVDNELLQKMELYDMPTIERGIVVYCKADSSTAGNEQEGEQNTRNALQLVQKGILSILSNHKVFYSAAEKRIAFCCDFVDVDALEKRLVTLLRQYEKQCSVVVSIGISGVFQSMAEIAT